MMNERFDPLQKLGDNNSLQLRRCQSSHVSEGLALRGRSLRKCVEKYEILFFLSFSMVSPLV